MKTEIAHTVRLVARLNKWERVIDRIRACPPEKFNMSTWIRVPAIVVDVEDFSVTYTRDIPLEYYEGTTCGGVCCFGGHAILALGSPVAPLSPWFAADAYLEDYKSIEKEACSLLDISQGSDYAGTVFYSHRWRNERMRQEYSQNSSLMTKYDNKFNKSLEIKRKEIAIRYFEWYMQYWLPDAPFFGEYA